MNYPRRYPSNLPQPNPSAQTFQTDNYGRKVYNLFFSNPGSYSVNLPPLPGSTESNRVITGPTQQQYYAAPPQNLIQPSATFSGIPFIQPHHPSQPSGYLPYGVYQYLQPIPPPSFPDYYAAMAMSAGGQPQPPPPTNQIPEEEQREQEREEGEVVDEPTGHANAEGRNPQP